MSDETMQKVDEALKVSLSLKKDGNGEKASMNGLKIFDSKEFGEVRVLMIDDEPWMIAKDVATALGYRNARDAVMKHVDEEDKGVAKCDTPGGAQNLAVINESGMYSLVFGSKLHSAKRFKHWVTSEVLPSIRESGTYQKPLSPQEMMRIQLGMIDDHEDRLKKLESSMTIDYGQQRVLGEAVNQAVIDVLGGKESKAYKEMGRKVFAECNGDLKHYFNVNARNNIPKLRFDEALEYVREWKPCTNTMILIQESNTRK